MCKNKITPEEDLDFILTPDALPSKPEYNFPLWNKYTKDKLGGPMDKNSKNMFDGRCKFQKKLFGLDHELTDTKFLENFRKVSYEGLKPVASIMGLLGCCLFPSTSNTVVINANEFIADRKCALKPCYTYDNHALQLVISKPRGRCCGLRSSRALPALVFAPSVGLDANHDVWQWQGKALAAGLKAVVVHVCFRPAPEFEDPARMMDIVAAVKWTVAKSAELGVDPSRLGLMASSAGCFITTVAALELAARSESALVKTSFLEVPLVFPDNMLGPYDMLSAFQRFVNNRVLKGQYVWFAGGEADKSDWQKRFDEKDVTLHCLHAPMELLKKLPHHVIISAEFDDFRWQTDEYAAQLNKAGVLLDYVLYPGAVHMTIPMKLGRLVEEAVKKYLC